MIAIVRAQACTYMDLCIWEENTTPGGEERNLGAAAMQSSPEKDGLEGESFASRGAPQWRAWVGKPPEDAHAEKIEIAAFVQPLRPGETCGPGVSDQAGFSVQLARPGGYTAVDPSRQAAVPASVCMPTC